MAPPGYDISNLRVLVAEDNVFMRRVIVNILRQFNVRHIDAVADGLAAWQELSARVPDLLIADWVMEPLDGLELVNLVRTSPDSPNPYLPIIMLTAHTEAARIITARDAGMSTYLAKPISPQQLYDRLEALIERPKPFVRTNGFFGPDRRRRMSHTPPSHERRLKTPKPKAV